MPETPATTAMASKRVRDPPYDPDLIRDYILCNAGRPLTKLQVIKIAAIAYGHVMGEGKGRLFASGLEAWEYGPVVPAIYETLKHTDGAIIELPYCKTKIDDGPDFVERKDFINETIRPDIKSILEAVVEEYAGLSGSDLIRLTHVKGSPWAKAYKKGEYNTPIDDADIARYYSDLD